MLFDRKETRLKRLLIVEDEPLIAFDNEHFLVTHGYSVVATIDNTPAALAVIAEEAVDMILCDVRLNNSDGRDVAIAAKKAGIPLLFVTATCPTDAPEIAIGCLAKPYVQKDLKAAIDAVEAHLDGAKPKKLPRGLSLYPSQ